MDKGCIVVGVSPLALVLLIRSSSFAFFFGQPMCTVQYGCTFIAWKPTFSLRSIRRQKLYIHFDHRGVLNNRQQLLWLLNQSQSSSFEAFYARNILVILIVVVYLTMYKHFYGFKTNSSIEAMDPRLLSFWTLVNTKQYATTFMASSFETLGPKNFVIIYVPYCLLRPLLPPLLSESAIDWKACPTFEISLLHMYVWHLLQCTRLVLVDGVISAAAWVPGL